MRRILVLLILLVVIAVVEAQVGSFSWPPATAETTKTAATKAVATPTQAPREQSVFCQSIVMLTTAERRWMAYVKHPHPGKESLEASLRRLPQDEVPSPFTEDLLDRYVVTHTVCFKNWAQIFQLTDDLSFGAASRRLDSPDVMTEHAMRRAVLKYYFKDAWEIAETMFPLEGE